MKCKRSFFASGSLIVAAILLYATTVEPTALVATNYRLREGQLARILAGRKIALLSDLHFGNAGEPLGEETLRRLEEINPDIILLTGDFVEWGSGRQAYENAFDFLARLRAPLGVYAVLGDADMNSSRRSCEFCHQPGSGTPTQRHDVLFLKNGGSTIATPAGEVRIVGLEPGSRSQAAARLPRLLEGSEPILLLSHSSVVYEGIETSREVLVLSGDTHGGQIRLPRWFWRLTEFKPDPEHISGLFRDGEKTLVVSRGIGTSHLRFRLGAPPEIVVLEFGDNP